MARKIDKLRTSMTFNMVGAVVMLLAVFGVIVSVIGFISFTSAFKREYSTTTYHMANTAATLVHGDSLDDYLEGGKQDEYSRTRSYLDAYCKAMSVSIVYVIKVDTSDYGSFVSVFNCVNNSVDDTDYEPWELGHKRDTTNETYRKKYKAIYSKESPYETIYRTKPGEGLHPHVTTLVPVMDSDDNVAGILCLQRPTREINNARLPFLTNIAISTALLALLFGVFVTLYLRGQFVLPIRKVSLEAIRFAKDNKKGEELTSDISRIAEISGLALSIDKMESEMISYIDNLTSVTAEKERISTELSLASRIQENSVPNIFPAFPDRNDFDIYASMKPAKEVGGDFYNFFFVDDDHLAVAIGDVSGKGIPAALFMMVTNILLSDRAKMGGRPSEILEYVNDNLCEHNTADMFVTIWLGILEISTGKLTTANAGHEDPAVYRKGGSFELVKTKHGFVAGGMADVTYTDHEITLNEGDKLFIYTDGIPEATDANESLYGLERMTEALCSVEDRSCMEIVEGVRRSVDVFVGDAPQFDDLTMLCLEIGKR